jgi:hypothetical protein
LTVVVLENSDIPQTTTVATDIAAMILNEEPKPYPWKEAPMPRLSELQRLADGYVSAEAFPGTSRLFWSAYAIERSDRGGVTGIRAAGSDRRKNE